MMTLYEFHKDDREFPHKLLPLRGQFGSHSWRYAADLSQCGTYDALIS
jgi:hypothetical protein